VFKRFQRVLKRFILLYVSPFVDTDPLNVWHTWICSNTVIFQGGV